jgi:hypothetical protein
MAMGLLDDAIKDHLELKRRHGADPGEVARLEHEALGPARREPATAATTLADEPAHDDADLVYDDEVPADERLEAPGRYAGPEPDEEEPEPPTGAAEPAPEPPPAADTELRQVPEFDIEPHPEPEEAAPESESEPEPTVDQPTRQFSLEELEDASKPPTERAAPAEEDEEDEPEPPHADVVPADEEPDGEDVLEETPEFLQETPEHDRLWFEQKPPKDFDF